MRKEIMHQKSPQTVAIEDVASIGMAIEKFLVSIIQGFKVGWIHDFSEIIGEAVDTTREALDERRIKIVTKKGPRHPVSGQDAADGSNLPRIYRILFFSRTEQILMLRERTGPYPVFFSI